MKTLLSLLVLVAPLATRAQNIVALQNYIPTDEGFARGTAGWTFQPSTNVSVTALGCFVYILTNQPGPMLVGLWAADGTLLASNAVTTNSLLIGQARYEPIDPVLLSTNESYYLGALASSGAMIIDAFAPGDGGGGYVGMAPEIQLGMAVGSTNTGFTFPEMADGPSGSAIFAPDFEFQDGMLPPVLNIALVGDDVLVSWSGTYTSFTLQENSDLNITNWMDVTNSVNVAGGENQVLISSPANDDFYRLSQ